MQQTIQPNVYTVFWLENGKPESMSFDSNELLAVITETENLRKRKLKGEKISHITSASESDDSVGQGGVGEPSSDYHLLHWKRRIDPNIPLGRPRNDHQ